MSDSIALRAEPAPDIASTVNAIRRGDEVEDDAIDSWLSEPYRRVSRRFWTPVIVARTAALWMEEVSAARILDVGAGVGKFCVVAALASDLHVTGIEQRHRLAVEASSLARRFGVSHRCRVLSGTLSRIDLAAFDGVYAFNPFAENVYPHHERLDETVELSSRRLREDLGIVENGLERMAVGGALVTYHGFGGEIPDTFELVRDEPIGTAELRLWVKRRRRSGGGVWIEVGDQVARRALTRGAE